MNDDHAFSILEKYFKQGVRSFVLSSKLETLRDRKEVWINMLMLKQLAMMKHKLQPYNFIHHRVTEVTNRELLPFYDQLPDHYQKDLYDYFAFALCNKTVDEKLCRWYDLDIRRLRTLDEFLEAIMLYQSIVAHFSAHLDSKDSKELKESPLKVLTYLTDLSKKVPDFVKFRSVDS